MKDGARRSLATGCIFTAFSEFSIKSISWLGRSAPFSAGFHPVWFRSSQLCSSEFVPPKQGNEIVDLGSPGQRLKSRWANERSLEDFTFIAVFTETYILLPVQMIFRTTHRRRGFL